MQKKDIYITAASILLIVCCTFISCKTIKNLNHNNTETELKTLILEQEPTKKEYKSLKKTLKHIKGLSDFKIIKKENKVQLNFNPNKISYEEITYKVNDLGIKLKTKINNKNKKLKVVDFQVNYD
jgi:hypothetical protein